MRSCIESQSLANVNGISNSIRPSQEVNLKCTNRRKTKYICIDVCWKLASIQKWPTQKKHYKWMIHDFLDVTSIMWKKIKNIPKTSLGWLTSFDYWW